MFEDLYGNQYTLMGKWNVRRGPRKRGLFARICALWLSLSLS